MKDSNKEILDKLGTMLDSYSLFLQQGYPHFQYTVEGQIGWGYFRKFKYQVYL